MSTTASALVYVGSFTEPIRFGTGQVLEGKGRGIATFRFDSATGALAPCFTAEGVRNPSFLAFHPHRPFLYCVNEFKEFEGQASGAVSAFAIEPGSGALRFLNMTASGGTDPCHLMLTQTGSHVLVANFASGSVCVLPIRADGTLAPASDFVQHHGSSLDPRRQAGPHAHSIALDPKDRHVLVPDLGMDKVLIYRFDAVTGTLAPNPHQPWVDCVPGAGPRQIVLHPGGRFAYLINELNSSVTAFGYDPALGRLTALQTLSTLPGGFTGQSTCAEVQITGSGRFLYGSNRGHDSLVIYAIDASLGTLTLVGHEATRGRIPRHFEVNPQGDFLIAANQDSGDLVVFRIDPASGKLTDTGQRAQTGTPVCVRFRSV